VTDSALVDPAEPADPADPAGAPDPWSGVVGQEGAIRQLAASVAEPVHAYLLVGPSGSGKRSLARGFAAELLAAGWSDDERDRHVRLALAEQHPDLRVVEPEGNTFRKGDAERLVRHATLAPVEGRRKVVVGLGTENMEDEAAGYLLKTIEEPPASTVFVLLATQVVPELVTIASRCLRVELPGLTAEAVAERLVAEGVEPERAEAAAVAAGGDLERARTLATDDRLALRHEAWRAVPRQLDGTGHKAAGLVGELQAMIGDALGPLHERQAAEAAALDEQIEAFGLRGAGKKDLEARHKREVRRFRTAELRFGLATLAAVYRDALVDGQPRRSYVAAVDRLDAAGLALDRYPNETLLLQALLAQLPPVTRL
jgi:DNA polymerase-3 subunit delta'